jgi:hypothetical protein
MQSTIKQVVDYLFHVNVQPMAVYGQESCLWSESKEEHFFENFEHPALLE